MHYPIQGLTSAIFGYAIEHGWRESNPVEKVPRRRESDPHEIQIYSVEQVQAIAREAQTSRRSR